MLRYSICLDGVGMRQAGGRVSPWYGRAFCTLLLLVLLLPMQAAEELPDLDPNAPAFPASSIADFSHLLDAPAGKHGFLMCGRNGHFYFQDGTRARFWGINVAKDSVFEQHEVIDQAVEAIARAGFNLVRFHHIDDATGLLPPERAGAPERIDPDKLDRLDYWISRLKEKGIYVYLDLLDFRTFTEAEGIKDGKRLGRGAKPYAVFVEPLLILQQRYAKALLRDHINPYTGLSYAEDPAVCMIELCDENGLLAKRKLWDRLLPAYRDMLVARWNGWLRAKYGSTEALARAWSSAGSKLEPEEDIERGTVRLGGNLPRESGAFPRPLVGPEEPLGRARFNDATAFAASVDRQYLKRMAKFLRGLKVKVPVTAVLAQRHMADVRAVAEELDFVATNFYWDHVFFRAGSEWTLPGFYYNANPIAETGPEALMPTAYLARVRGRPFVIREWNYCWPNKYRAAGMLEMVAYASLQDADAAILFTLDTRPSSDKLGFFDVRRDPTRWGLAALCAKVFMSGDIRPAPHDVAIAYSTVDTIVGEQDFASTVYDIGWCFRISSEFFDRECTPSADLTVASGRSAAGAYRGRNLLLYADDRAGDELGRPAERSLAGNCGYDVAEAQAGVKRFRFAGKAYDAGQTVTLEALPPFSVTDVRKRGYEPIGADEDSDAAYGFFDPGRNVSVFQTLHAEEVVRVALDMMAATFDAGPGHTAVGRRRYVAETGEIIRDTRQGVLLIDAPRVKGVAGELSQYEPYGDLRVETTTRIGAILLTSLDNRALSPAGDFALKVVTIATNDKEDKRFHAQDGRRRIFALYGMGRPPVLTHGFASDAPTRVFLGGELLLEVYLRNGAAELVRRGGRSLLYCDTPGVRWRIGGFDSPCRVVNLSTGQVLGGQASGAWPDGCRLLEVRPG